MPANGEARRPHVLVVEDNPPTVALLRELLESEGYRVTAATSTATGQTHIATDQLDLVLLDVMLPDGNGLELCRRVRAQEHGVYLPIILLTAIGSEAGRHAGFAAGADDYVTKPFETADLLDRVDVWVRTRRRLEQQQVVLTRQAELLELASDAIFVRDLTGIITYWNAGAEALYGWPRAEALGRVSHELLRTEFPRPRAAIEAIVLDEGRWHGQLAHARRDGTRVMVASRWALQRDAEGQPLAILELNTDVTTIESLREVERARLTRQLESLTRTAREVAHLLNNDLALAVGNAELLQLQPEPTLPDQLRRMLDDASNGLTNAVTHVARLQQAAHGAAGGAPPGEQGSTPLPSE